MLGHSRHDKRTEDDTGGNSTWGQAEAAPDLVWEGVRAECHRSPPGEIKKRPFKQMAWHKDTKERENGASWNSQTLLYQADFSGIL